jgi:ferredoxin, 2Fe-2S
MAPVAGAANRRSAAVASLKVTFVQANGVEKVVEDAASGQSLMTLARANTVDGILADCGGCCSCSTCHVYVDPQWREAVGPPDAVESSTLEMAMEVRENSRLSCQIILRPELDGLRVVVADNF